MAVPAGEFVDLGDLRQSGGKVVRAWAALLDDTTDFDPAMAVSNTFEMEWPPKSGRMETFPELDRVAWFGVEAARAKIIVAQREFLDRLSAGGI